MKWRTSNVQLNMPEKQICFTDLIVCDYITLSYYNILHKIFRVMICSTNKYLHLWEYDQTWRFNHECF